MLPVLSPHADEAADASLTKREQYYRYMRQSVDNYAGQTLTAEEKNSVERHMRGLSTGSSAMIPLWCAGELCPFALRCPYQQIGKAPIGKPCLVEIQLLQHWVVTFMEEYDVDPSSFTEVGYCNELAEIEIMLYRMNQLLSRPENADGTIEQTMGIAHDGTPIQQRVISPWQEQKERLQNRKSKIIKLMVGDRQEKYKKEAALKVREQKDPSSKMADVRRQIESLQRNLTQIEKGGLPPGPMGSEDSATPFEKSSEITELEGILTPDRLISGG